MKIESRVILSHEELEIINQAFEILSDFVAESIRIQDPHIQLKDKAKDAYDHIDNFLCEYSNIYE